ncbi:MAG: hypothetical protein ACLR17_21785 [Enterobacteriaceae bacterium]
MKKIIEKWLTSPSRWQRSPGKDFRYLFFTNVDRRQTFFKNNLTKITVVDDFNSIWPMGINLPSAQTIAVLLSQIQAMIGNRLQIFKVILTRILATAHPKRSGNTQRRAVPAKFRGY